MEKFSKKKRNSTGWVTGFLVLLMVVFGCHKLADYASLKAVPESLLWEPLATDEFNGTSGFLRKSVKIDGIPCACDPPERLDYKVSAYPNGRLRYCRLEYDIAYGDIECSDWISLYEDGSLRSTFLRGRYDAFGVSAAVERIDLYPNGLIQHCKLRETWEKDGNVITAGSWISFWPNGILKDVRTHHAIIQGREYNRFILDFDSTGKLIRSLEISGRGGG